MAGVQVTCPICGDTNAKKHILLKGQSEVISCPTCRAKMDKVEAEAKQQHEAIEARKRQEKRAARWDDTTLPRRVKRVVDELASEVTKEREASILNLLESNKWYYLSGSVGVGKTTYAGQVMRVAILEGYSATYITARQINAQQRTSYTYSDWIKELRGSLLIIDEVSRITAADTLEDIVSQAYDDDTAVIFISNESMAKWLPNVNYYITSRTSECGLSEVVFNGADKRVNESK